VPAQQPDTDQRAADLRHRQQRVHRLANPADAHPRPAPRPAAAADPAPGDGGQHQLHCVQRQQQRQGPTRLQRGLRHLSGAGHDDQHRRHRAAERDGERGEMRRAGGGDGRGWVARHRAHEDRTDIGCGATRIAGFV
jgi:hypothetical protein